MSSSIELWLSALHLAAAGAMAGLIWLVQLLVYPAFRDAIDHPEGSSWQRYHARHSTRISFVVGPLILMEIGSLTALLAVSETLSAALLCCAGLTVITTAVTAWVSVRFHKPLSTSSDRDQCHELVAGLIRWNWLRTVCWTARVPLALLLLIKVASGA